MFAVASAHGFLKVGYGVSGTASAVRVERQTAEGELVSRLEGARSRIEQRFLDGGVVLLAVLDVPNRLVASLENLSGSLDDNTAEATIGRLSATVGQLTALPGIASNSFGKASAGATSANDNKGKGSNQNTNEFTGAITAVVTAVLPNGHLMISGEKQIGVNRNVDVLRFSGQVDPRMIGQGNAVPSTSVANVRIEQRGRGATADAHAVGWLSRFFLNIAPS